MKDFGACCPVAALLAVVFAACCRLDSLFAAARRLAAAPSHETVRQALRSNPPDLDTLERRLNHALTADLPRSLTRRRPRLAIIERRWRGLPHRAAPCRVRALRVETSPSTTRRTSFTRSSLAFIASTSFACRSIGGPLCWYVVPIGDCSKVVGEPLADLLGEPAALHAFAPSWRPVFWNLADQTPEALLNSGMEWLQTLAVIRVEGAEAAEFRAVYDEAVRGFRNCVAGTRYAGMI